MLEIRGAEMVGEILVEGRRQDVLAAHVAVGRKEAEPQMALRVQPEGKGDPARLPARGRRLFRGGTGLGVARQG